MKVKSLSGLPFKMFPLLFQDSLNHSLLWLDQSEITVLTIFVPTKVFEGTPLAIMSCEWAILVMKISYFPGKKYKKLLRNHQQLNRLQVYYSAAGKFVRSISRSGWISFVCQWGSTVNDFLQVKAVQERKSYVKFFT